MTELGLSFAPTRLYLSLKSYSCVHFRMDPEGPTIKSWLAKQALGCALEISFIPGCDLGTKYMDAVATKKGESWEVKVIEGGAVEEFPSEAHEEDSHSLFGATGKGFLG